MPGNAPFKMCQGRSLSKGANDVVKPSAKRRDEHRHARMHAHTLARTHMRHAARGTARRGCGYAIIRLVLSLGHWTVSSGIHPVPSMHMAYTSLV